MENADRVALVLENLPNDLEPAALFNKLSTKSEMEKAMLGHAYYTVYYGYEMPAHSPLARPSSTRLSELYAPRKPKPKPKSLRVVERTDPAVYASDVCDAILQYDGVIPPDVFCQAIRNVHPHELKNDYYHRAEICGATFEEHLAMVNRRLHEYFSANRNLDDVLSGIKKCLCLRMLSSNMYYYRNNPARLDPAIAKLMQFYTLTDFLHESSQEAFGAHLHMIRKYKQLNELIEELIKPEFKRFLRITKCRFDEIVRVEPEDFVVRIRDVSSDVVHELPHTLPILQAFVSSRIRPMPPRMSSNDMVHKVQSHFLLPRTAFDEGIRFMKVLMYRLENRELTLADTYDDLFKIYERTVDALNLLRELNMHKDSDDEEFFAMMKQMDRYKRKYRRTRLNPSMVDWSQFTVAGPARSPSPLTRKHSRSPSSPSSRKRRREERGGAKSKRSKRSKKVLIRK
jgi:hypothetical protein